MDTLYELCWIFFLYAFLGWCAEVIFAAVKTKPNGIIVDVDDFREV